MSVWMWPADGDIIIYHQHLNCYEFDSKSIWDKQPPPWAIGWIYIGEF